MKVQNGSDNFDSVFPSFHFSSVLVFSFFLSSVPTEFIGHFTGVTLFWGTNWGEVFKLYESLIYRNWLIGVIANCETNAQNSSTNNNTNNKAKIAITRMQNEFWSISHFCFSSIQLNWSNLELIINTNTCLCNKINQPKIFTKSKWKTK